MRFRRAKSTLPQPTIEAEDLAAVSLDAIVREIASRGFGVVCSGAWEESVGGLEVAVARLEARADEAEEFAASCVCRLRELAGAWRVAEGAGMVDGTALFEELGRLASVELPFAVERACRLMDENAELRVRADRSECEADLLAGVVIGDALGELRQGDHDDG